MADFDARHLLMSDTAAVWDVVCPGGCKQLSAEESVSATHLVFPYRGVYVHHVGRAEAVAEANQVIFLNEDDLIALATLLRAVMPAFRSRSTRRRWSSCRLTIIWWLV
jgi:hypothetical protein